MSWDLKGKEISVFITGNFSADFIKIEARYKNRRQRIIKCFCILLSADNNDLKRIRDMNFKDLKQLCLSHGFTNVAPLACDTIELKPEVRQMCASDSCHKYNKCWSCPPGCGTLEECEQRVRKYKLGILVQTVGQLEDSMDGEGMMRTEAMHKASFYSLEKDLRKKEYNPFESMVKNSPQDFETLSKLILTSMMSECSKSFERLPILQHASIIRNILYSGVWSKYEYVQAKKKKRRKSQ